MYSIHTHKARQKAKKHRDHLDKMLFPSAQERERKCLSVYNKSREEMIKCSKQRANYAMVKLKELHVELFRETEGNPLPVFRHVQPERFIDTPSISADRLIARGFYKGGGELDNERTKEISKKFKHCKVSDKVKLLKQPPYTRGHSHHDFRPRDTKREIAGDFLHRTRPDVGWDDNVNERPRTSPMKANNQIVYPCKSSLTKDHVGGKFDDSVHTSILEPNCKPLALFREGFEKYEFKLRERQKHKELYGRFYSTFPEDSCELLDRPRTHHGCHRNAVQYSLETMPRPASSIEKLSDKQKNIRSLYKQSYKPKV